MKKILLSTAVVATLSLAGGEFTTFENNDVIASETDATLTELETLKQRIASLEGARSQTKGDSKDNTKNDDLAKKVEKLTKKIKKLNKKLNKVKAHDAFDNIKFSMDFRNTLDNIEYKYNDYSYQGKDLSGGSAKNDSLLTSRLILNMKSKPTKKLSFQGQIAAYSNWGTHLFEIDDASLKSWAGSSKSGDTIFRVRRAYFVYNDKNYAFSIGRRPASDGFLANFRENNKKATSPLAHITNMEVDAGMIKFKTDKFLLKGSFLKLVYGRAHSGGMESVYDLGGKGPYAQEEGDVHENVDFFVTLGSIYNDGQYNLMGQHAVIFDTKGARAGLPVGATLPDGLGKNKSLDAGTAHLSALSLQVDGVGDEINDFLDDTTLFVSGARSLYQPDDGKQLLGATDDRIGYSYWVGAVIPDMITEDGKFGLEYNYGTQFWTPMTWAEDTAIGSKISTRGESIEAYWNFNLMGEKNLPSQIRYTHTQHDYTPNIRCSGWVTPEEIDVEADNIRLSVSYKY